MAKVITLGAQKGGVSKTTSACAIAYLLALQHKVLLCDMDQQGNASEMFLQADLEDWLDEGKIEGHIYHALRQRNAERYILPVMREEQHGASLDLLGSSDSLVKFTRQVVYKPPRLDVEIEETQQGSNIWRNLVLKRTLEPLMDQYDYIIIDTPPALSEFTYNALSASDGVVALFEPSKFSLTALKRFFQTILDVQARTNPNLRILGILPTLVDQRRTNTKVLLEEIQTNEDYAPYVLPMSIHRKEPTKRLPIYGFLDNPEIMDAVDQYIGVTNELVHRVNLPVRV